ncbi:MAG: sulfotransferase [Promethearchaeota archaeon]|nr:MAG: sulfotransferase [Candidatus Lokiarchaeota archaeon]
MNEGRNLKVCFIIGAPHSGSTLLGLILGSHNSAFFAGEANKVSFFNDSNFEDERKFCRICGKECKIWKKVNLNDANLYVQLYELTKKSIIIDSTKNLEWISEQMKLADDSKLETCIIFLKRDVRAVMNSLLRKYPTQTIEKLIDRWNKQITGTKELFNSFRGNKIEIFYEDLASNLNFTIERLCKFLNVKYEPDMKDYYYKEHHSIGGNIGTHYLLLKAKNREEKWLLTERNEYYYRDHPLSIKIDERWKKELDKRFEKIIEERTGSLFPEFTWNN